MASRKRLPQAYNATNAHQNYSNTIITTTTAETKRTKKTRLYYKHTAANNTIDGQTSSKTNSVRRCRTALDVRNNNNNNTNTYSIHHILISTLQAKATLTLLTILTLSSWLASYGGATAAPAAASTAVPTKTTAMPSATTTDENVGDIAYAAFMQTNATSRTVAVLQQSPPAVPLVDFNNSSAFLAAVVAASATNASNSIGAVGSRIRPILFATGTPTASPALNTLLTLTLNVSMEPPLHGSATAATTGTAATSLTMEEAEFTMPPLQAIVVSIILLIVILGTVVGNVLVCIAVCMVRKLRRPCNYLLVSLALSDLCVAVLVMPMALLSEVLQKWDFGTVMCDIWVAFDVLCCTASILNLCAISVDRYLAITKPLEYGVKRTPRRMMLCVAVVWLAAACISLPPLLILGNEHVGENGEPICTVCQNSAYQIYATLGSFYIPLSVMLFVYYQIFRAARRIVLEEKRAQTHLQHALNGTGSPQALPPGQTDLGGNGTGGGSSGNGQRHSSVGNTSLTYSTCGGLSAHHGHHGSGGGVSGSTGLLGSPHHKKLRFQLAKEKKASTTLGIIMSAFTICWLPFFILALVRPFIESETMHVPASVTSLFLWLGYANSLLNPIIYATLNRDFRKPFQEILYFRCSSLNTMMRENYYQDQYGEPPSQRVMLGDERHGARESFL